MNKNKIYRVLVVSLIVFFLFAGLTYWTISGLDFVRIQTNGNAYPRFVREIECSLINNSLRAIKYGDLFYVEEYNSEPWIPLTLNHNVRFQTGQMDLKPLSTVTLSFPVYLYSSFENEGFFRIVVPVKYGNSSSSLYYTFYVE